MNERIRELVGQAKFVAEETLNKQISANTELNAFSEKFAELIVGECIRKIEDIAESSNDPQPIYRVAVELLEHFGVEE